MYFGQQLCRLCKVSIWRRIGNLCSTTYKIKVYIHEHNNTIKLIKYILKINNSTICLSVNLSHLDYQYLDDLVLLGKLENSISQIWNTDPTVTINAFIPKIAINLNWSSGPIKNMSISTHSYRKCSGHMYNTSIKIKHHCYVSNWLPKVVGRGFKSRGCVKYSVWAAHIPFGAKGSLFDKHNY